MKTSSAAVAFYPDRDALEKSDHTIRDEFKTGAEIWAAWFAGTHVSTQDLLAKPNGLRRLILADPDGEQIGQLAQSFNRPLTQLQADIRTLTKQAGDKGVQVCSYDGALVPMVIGNPQSENCWVRFEIPIYFQTERPNLIIHRANAP